jgi:hypothetical protein
MNESIFNALSLKIPGDILRFCVEPFITPITPNIVFEAKNHKLKLKSLKRGDIVIKLSEIDPRSNKGRYVFDGKTLQELYTGVTYWGSLPPWMSYPSFMMDSIPQQVMYSNILINPIQFTNYQWVELTSDIKLQLIKHLRWFYDYNTEEEEEYYYLYTRFIGSDSLSLNVTKTLRIEMNKNIWKRNDIVFASGIDVNDELDNIEYQIKCALESGTHICIEKLEMCKINDELENYNILGVMNDSKYQPFDFKLEIELLDEEEEEDDYCFKVKYDEDSDALDESLSMDYYEEEYD